MKIDRVRLGLLFAFWQFCFHSLGFSGERPALPSEWSFDRLKLKNGAVLKGMIIEESPTAVRFQHVHRLPGRPTVCMTAFFFRSEIDKLEKLSDADREMLRNRIRDLDPNGEGERKRMESLELTAVEWNGKAKAARRYDSDYFSLISNAPEEIVRRSAVRLEQIYAAYARFLPPRHKGGKPTTVVLYTSTEEYQKMLAQSGWKLQNPAFFDPAANRIVCGNNLLRLGDDLEKAKSQHAEQRAVLDKREADLRELYGKKPMELARYLQEIVVFRRKMGEADRYNDSIFDRETKQLFAILYHEAFHAYVGNFVFLNKAANPSNPKCGEIPRWLNEGLAQVFESSLVESGELRVDYPDRNRLERVKIALIKGELMPVPKLLGVGPKQFMVAHDGQRAEADRTYLAAWALSAYLMFDRRLVGSDRMNEFVQSIHEGANAEEAFCKLVGQPLAVFELQFHTWLKKQSADRSLLEPPGGMKKP